MRSGFARAQAHAGPGGPWHREGHRRNVDRSNNEVARMADQTPPLELWGGLECTVARIGDDFRDQSAETGHRDRIEDLDRIAAPRHPDAALSGDLGDGLSRPARGGGLALARRAPGPSSTPRHRSHRRPGPPRQRAALHQSARPGVPGVARRATPGASRERYPWIGRYTPVNEPLTTARFSALYGHWYPARTRLRRVLAGARPTVPGDRARDAGDPAVSPDAQLVQTDDFGKTFSTPLLAYQAEHDNERRWLTFDLLCGRVDRQHPLWGFFTYAAGVEPSRPELVPRRRRCPPDIIGINHYLTSERFLDQRLQRYPRAPWGGNGQHRYADVEAVRVAAGGRYRPGRSPARGVGALPPPDRGHGGAPRLHPRRATALAHGGVERRPDRARGGSRHSRRHALVAARHVRLELAADATQRHLRDRRLRRPRAAAPPDGARAGGRGARCGGRLRPSGARPAGLVEARVPLLSSCEATPERAGLPARRVNSSLRARPARSAAPSRASASTAVLSIRSCRGARWTSPTRRASRRRWPVTSRGPLSTRPATSGSPTPSASPTPAFARTPPGPRRSRGPAPRAASRSSPSRRTSSSTGASAAPTRRATSPTRSAFMERARPMRSGASLLRIPAA